MNYLELLPKPAPDTVNVNLRSPRLATLRDILGEPRDTYTGDCQPITNARLKSRMATRDFGNFKATGVDVALESLKHVLTDVKRELPDLHALISTAGMTCARKVKLPRSDGTIKLGKNPSNHSWGLAIDLKLNGALDKQGDNKCFRGLLVLARYFNAAGWFWGVSFPTEDAMHFEVSESLLKSWRKDARI